MVGDRRHVLHVQFDGRNRNFDPVGAKDDLIHAGRYGLKCESAQLVGGEGIKERCDFLAMAAMKGVTLEELAWMENVYSPAIGALNEPIALAAQNGLGDGKG